MTQPDYYYGIDFGTTNSAMVGIDETLNVLDAQPTYFGDSHGEPFPSLFGIDEDGNEIYGREAWERKRQLKKNAKIISSVKTALGTGKKWVLNDDVWTPVDVTAKIFECLKKENDMVNEKINAVVSIPVGFSRKKRKELRRAAELADINIKSFVKESTAALFKFYNKVRHFNNIMIFDWGGGTLDISLLENQKGKIKELAVNTMGYGGDNIDIKIARMLHNKFARDKNISTGFDDMEEKYQDLLLVKSEEAKRELSFDDIANVTIVKYGELGTINETVNIDLLEMLLEDDINNAIKTIENVLKDAELSRTELDCIIMAGGTSKIRLLQKEMKRIFDDQKLFFPDNSEWKCAEGAALMSINSGVYRLNQDIGVILSDNSFYPLFRKDEEVKKERKVFEFGLTEDTQDARFIFAGKNNKTEENKILGYANVDTYGFLDERLKMKAYIDKDLIFHSKIKSTKKSEEDQVNWNYDRLKFYYDVSDLVESDEYE